MAQDLRPRAALTRAALATLLLAGCDGDGAAAVPSLAPAPAPRTVDVASVPDGELIDAVLRECHAPLRDQMGRVTATVTFADGSTVQAFAHLPDRVRLQGAAGRWLLRGDDVFTLDAGGEPVRPEQAVWVQRVRALLDAAAFGPLHRATGCRRLGPTTFTPTLPGERPVTVTLQPATLLPASLTFGDGPTVRVVDYLRTPTTWIARELDADGLGRVRVVFEASRIDWAEDFFAPPGGETRRPTTRIVGPGAQVETRSPTPIEVAGRAAQWIVVADPGTWRGRVDVYRPLHGELVRQDQIVAGFPVLFADAGQRWLAAPFRPRDGGPTFVAPDGWTLRTIAAGTWLVVYPASGDVAERIAAGERLLAQTLHERRRTAAGPVTAQPHFHLHEGEPDAAKLAAPVVRVAVRVQ